MGIMCSTDASTEVTNTDKMSFLRPTTRKRVKRDTESIHDNKELSFDVVLSKIYDVLAKQQVDAIYHRFIAKQLLIIWKEHDCSMIATNVKNGEYKLTTNRHLIQHKLCITTKGTKMYLKHQQNNKIWVDSKTYICLKAEPKENQQPFGKIHTLYRHLVKIPFAKYVYDAYNLIIPPEIVDEIGKYYNDFSDSDTADCKQERGLYYDKFDTYSIYKSYVESDAGDVEIDVDFNQNAPTILFNGYYGKIIDAFNAEILDFVTKNKFYQINTRHVNQLQVSEIEIDYYLRYEGFSIINQCCEYHIIAKLTGFNNLNKNQVVNTNETDDCKIKSQLFFIHWVSKHKSVKPQLKSFEKCCNFLKTNEYDNLRMIEPEKLFQFLQSEDFYRLNDEAQDIILSHSGSGERFEGDIRNGRRRHKLKLGFGTKEDLVVHSEVLLDA